MGQGPRKNIEFTKVVATGNDFIIVDNRKAALKGLSSLASKLCDRKYGIGADGLLVLERSKEQDFKMRIFNSDGSEAEMCGNGSRCIALYAYRKGIARANMKIDTLAGVLEAHVKEDIIKVRLMNPKNIEWNLCVDLKTCPYKLNFINTGVPHTVYFMDDIDKIDVASVGRDIRYHKAFSPHGTNANFVKVIDSKNIKIRTYERGIEDETLACGTGSVASALISAESHKMRSPITVHTRAGEKLKVYFEMVDGNFKNVYLEGKAALVFDGNVVTGGI